MESNQGVAYIGPGKVELQAIDFPVLALGARRCDHGVILKVVSTNICGSDQHMVRGRTTAPAGLVLGHEITGEVIEAGRDVEFVKVGDLVSVPVQHRLRPLPQLQGRQDGDLPEREPGPSRGRLRLCRHGRLGRRPGRVRHGPLRRLQPPALPGQRPGHGQDQGPHLPCRTYSRPASMGPSAPASVPGRSSTSLARGRSGSPAPPLATCWARRWSSWGTGFPNAWPRPELRLRDGRHIASAR